MVLVLCNLVFNKNCKLLIKLCAYVLIHLFQKLYYDRNITSFQGFAQPIKFMSFNLRPCWKIMTKRWLFQKHKDRFKEKYLIIYFIAFENVVTECDKFNVIDHFTQAFSFQKSFEIFCLHFH